MPTTPEPPPNSIATDESDHVWWRGDDGVWHCDCDELEWSWEQIVADATGELTVGDLTRTSDKRDECGCHRECTTLPHQCDRPCSWPNCLTEAEHRQLCDELDQEIG